jgi:hypothetical protein
MPQHTCLKYESDTVVGCGTFVMKHHGKDKSEGEFYCPTHILSMRWCDIPEDAYTVCSVASHRAHPAAIKHLRGGRKCKADAEDGSIQHTLNLAREQ